MTHGSLFSGIGGFDLAAEWMGWQNVFHCEWNDFGQKVLKHYWPKAISYHDITKTNFTIHRGTIDIVTGGFPCQPYSMAGKRKGKEDERHLWPNMLRTISEIQPRWVVGENVFGLVNWSGGLVFHEVQADLEAAGYEVFPYVLPAAAVNAPHRRDRVWFVAYAKNYGCKQRGEGINGWQEHKSCDWDKVRNITTTNCEKSNAPHPNGNGFNRSDREHEVNAGEGGVNAFGDIEQVGEFNDANGNGLERSISSNVNKQQPSKKKHDEKCIPIYKRTISFDNFPTQSPICTGDDGISARLDGITFSKWRNESIKAAGNAIVPQVALQIFKAIEQYEKQNPA